MQAAAQKVSADAFGDTFRFDAAGKTDKVRGLNFDDGDRIVLHDYAKGTFHDQAGGNPLAVSGKGASVTLDSLNDLRELDRASSAVHVRQDKYDTLIIDIDQPGPDHTIRIIDMAHAYF